MTGVLPLLGASNGENQSSNVITDLDALSSYMNLDDGASTSNNIPPGQPSSETSPVSTPASSSNSLDSRRRVGSSSSHQSSSGGEPSLEEKVNVELQNMGLEEGADSVISFLLGYQRRAYLYHFGLTL